MKAYLEKREALSEVVEATKELRKVPNEEAAVENIRALEDRSRNQRLAVVYQNPQKRRARDGFV
jgi:hypothetical protein